MWVYIPDSGFLYYVGRLTGNNSFEIYSSRATSSLLGSRHTKLWGVSILWKGSTLWSSTLSGYSSWPRFPTYQTLEVIYCLPIYSSQATDFGLGFPHARLREEGGGGEEGGIKTSGVYFLGDLLSGSLLFSSSRFWTLGFGFIGASVYSFIVSVLPGEP